ncbi:MAG: type II toxin-antitoxin system HicB family antitoxin [Phycisphaeraceae bacterium]
MKYAVVIEKTRTGYSAYAPDVPGVGVTARTVARVKKLLAEAIALQIEGLQQDGLPIPRPTTRTDYVEAHAA